MAPATAQNAAAAPPPGAPAISGTVTHVPGTGLPVLATPIGQLIFPGIGALPAQSIVRFEVIPAGAAFAAAPARIAPPATPIELSRQWPALGQLLEALDGIEPAAAAALSEAIIPKPGAKLSQAVLFFLSALRLGNIESWLGAGTVDRLRVGGKGHILSTIGEEFRRLSRVAADPGTGEWRAYLVPLYDGDRLEQLRFFHRRRGDAEGVPAEERGDRFLIDLQLSRLGQMQLDGLLRGKRFSLVLRSATALTPEARRDIADIFQDGCACTGLSGDLAFSGAGEFVPLPIESLAASSKGLSV